ncbi:hypothetical protein CCAX7_12050 [Capsulimonas corticalis]|uniref:Uncharacterized protein n=2 Tax=Capsulimonas corticalis TaxID=2219043 RepID=A0A402D4D4_9BACT|nr:hypothetical protein CCAX7_12050 [Capsulimonas corticalis]
MRFRTLLLASVSLLSASAIWAHTRESEALLPDLVITDLSWSPEQPKVGDPVTFRVTVKNVGAVATPEGVVCGVGFGVDHNNPVNWSDTFSHSIAPGQSVVLTSNGGADGKATWLATGGEHPDGVWATVNDSHRFPETDFVNNTFSRSIVVSDASSSTFLAGHGPDLVVTDFHWMPEHPRAGEPVSAEVTVRNRGDAPTPEGKIIGVGFFVTYCDSVVLYSNTDSHSLAPGQSVTLRTNGGTHGYPWRPMEGAYPLEAYVNDTGRITESDPGNNLMQKTITVEGAAPKIDPGEMLLTGAVFSHGNPSEPPWLLAANAFDGDVGTCLVDDPAAANSVGIALPPGQPSAITRIRFYPKPYSESDLVGGQFQGSNVGTDSAYETLYTVKKRPHLGWNDVTLHGAKPYQFLRFLGKDGTQCMISEIEFYGPRPIAAKP